MADQPSDQSRSTVDQQGQTIHGNPINVAGDYHHTSAQPDSPHDPSTTRRGSDGAFPYAFLFAVLGLVALVVILAIVNSTGLLPFLSGEPSPPTATTTSIPTQQVAGPTVAPTATVETVVPSTDTASATATAVPSVSVGTHCLEQPMADIPTPRTRVEVGAHDQDIPLNGNDFLVLLLTDLQKPIGLIHYLLFPDTGMVKVVTILDEQCKPITLDSDASLDNWETLEFVLNNQHYTIRLGLQGDHVRINRLRHIEESPSTTTNRKSTTALAGITHSVTAISGRWTNETGGYVEFARISTVTL